MMSESFTNEPSVKDRAAESLALWLIRRSCDGIGPLQGAHTLAANLSSEQPEKSATERVDALIRREMKKSFTAGAVTSFGGIVVAPLTLPAGFALSWLLQARMVATLAALYGHDLEDPWVQAGILASLEEGRTPDALGRFGQQVTQWGAAAARGQLSSGAAAAFSRTFAKRLITRATKKKAARLLRLAPVVGAIFAGSLDALGARAVARKGQQLFAPIVGQVVSREN